MSNKIPRHWNDCRYCHDDGLRSYELLDEPCSDHRGPSGERTEYTGADLYEPSEWVRSVVGRRYSGITWTETDGVDRIEIYECTGYDPRAGFWMRGTDSGQLINVSERAIDRTFHRVRS